MTDYEVKEIEPREKISCRLTAGELNLVNNRQIRSSIALIVGLTVLIAISVAFRLMSIISDITCGLFIGVFLIAIISGAVYLIDFRKNAKLAVSKAEKREFVYSVFDDEFMIEVFDGEDCLGKEKRQYSDIQSVEEYKGLWVFIILKRLFAIPKSDMPEYSALYCKLQGVIAKTKKRKRIRRFMLIFSFSLMLLSVVMIVIANIYR